MSIFNKAYQVLQLENQTSKSELRQIWKPQRPNREVIFKDFKIPETRQQNPQKVLLSKVLAVIDMHKQLRFADGITVMPISCKNKKLKSIFGSTVNVHRAIQFMKEIGLLAEYDSNYQFNAYYEKDNKCKSYAWNKVTEDLIKDYCKINSINIWKIRNFRATKPIIDIANFEKSEVKFSSKLHLLKPENYSEEQFIDFLRNCLYENYPQLEQYQKLADKINDLYFNEDERRQISFEPTFTWNKGHKSITKIGIRATNSLVSAKKEVEENDPEWIVYREDLLKQYELNYEFDVKSSVPRITYLLNKGKWLDNSVDLYKEMFETFINLCPNEKTEWNEESRNIFKYFHMRGYFDSYAMLAAHIKRAISLKGNYKREEWKDLDEVMYCYKKSIEETVGSLEYDSEVFFHESCIYLDVLYELLKRNYKVLQIYDGFYLNKECTDIQEIIKCKAYEYYHNNIKKEYKYKEVINNYKENVNKDISINSLNLQNEEDKYKIEQENKDKVYRQIIFNKVLDNVLVEVY